ncbi:J domain-containing protein [Neorhizobium sp. NCHU2750]|uniref:DnaJ domain-containing protein n=1 Tax=Neorhizobium sp. NCHU2750 TaxID=1825976 RepID=UPI000E73DB60
MTSDSRIFVGLKPIRAKQTQKPAPQGPRCQWDGCERVGQHKAPVGQEAEGLFFLFCTEHVKDYNSGYNYSSALSSPEVARYQKEAAAGARRSMGKTQRDVPNDAPLPSTSRSGSAKALNARKSVEQRKAQEAEKKKRKLRVLEAKAFDTLGLSEDATPREIKDAYKQKLKMLHPDANQGSRSSEDELRAAIEAFKILKLNDFC